MSSFRTLQYRPGVLTLLDQTKLPNNEVYVDLKDLESVAQAIEKLVVRGAPAIGVAAAFGVAVAKRQGIAVAAAVERLARTRPTAVNLFWALDRMKRAAAVQDEVEHLEREAQAIYDEDVNSSRKIGEYGAALIPDGARIVTHCNAGALATAELGTALAVVRAARDAGKKVRVYAGETRPVLQGARLTAWELQRDGFDVTLFPDVALAQLLLEECIDLAIVGADRIARNGDVANKVGTRGVACLLHAHGRPFYVAAPWSTIDMSLSTGREIPIEERDEREVTHIGEVRVAAAGVKVRNPAFDVTPAKWISNIITDRGLTGAHLKEGLAAQGG